MSRSELTSFHRDGDIGFMLLAEPGLAERVSEVFQYFDFHPDGSDSRHAFDFLVVRSERLSSGEADGNILAEDWFGCRIASRGDRLVVTRGDWQLTVEGEEARIVLSVPKGIDASRVNFPPDLFLLTSFALVYVFQRFERYVLHAACVCDRHGQGVVLVGDSDTGKSTLALSLVREGWNYLSDDSLVISPGDVGVTLQPFRSDFGLDPDAAFVFPEIEAASESWLAGGEKWRIKIRELHPSLRKEECVPRVIVFPVISGAEKSVVRPLSAADAMTRLIRQGSYLFSTDRADRAKLQLEIFGLLVAQCRAYELASGTDVMNEPESVSNLMRRLLEERLRSLATT